MMAQYLAGPSTYEITDSGNSTMKVVVRLRPENETELSSNRQALAKVVDEHVLVFDPSPDNSPSFSSTGLPNSNFPGRKRPLMLGKKHKDMRFAFDRVFDETASQVEVFEHTTKTIVDGILEGINCSVFAYGATGAGKTYTMLGNMENPGVMFLTMVELYKRINEVREEKSCEVAVSYCEVYNESIRDLIVPSGDLHLREDSQKGLVVAGLTRHIPKSAKDVLSMLESGNKMRTQHPTDANATSSRSHAVFQVFVNQKPRATGLSAQVMQAKMSLIDLAGSERATATTNRGERFREGANINKSLLALGNCINALADSKGKSVYVPYRNSKLTRLLKDSLGGNCRTVMIANISPSGLHLEDTYNTLKYADRAKQIKTKLVRNVLTVDFHLARYRTIVEELQNENSELKSKLAKKSPKNTFDAVEALRLQGLVKSVYGERSRLRKQMAELDASERETLLKICRKERDLTRVETISGDESRKAKIMARVESLHDHVTDIQREKQTVNEYLFSNNESVGRVQAEINRECDKSSASPALRQLMDTATEARRLETENAHLWKQTKHLLKYIKNQEKEINKSEKILVRSFKLVRQQHTMLRASNCLTTTLQEKFDDFVRMAEGGKGVAWADQSLSQQSVDNSLVDVSTSSFSRTQLAIFDNFVTHASPVRKTTEIQAGSIDVGDPVHISASFGILRSSVPRNNHMARCNHASPTETCSIAIENQSGKRTPRLNGVPTLPASATKHGTPLFVTTPRTAFTPKNYLKFHPLGENHSHPNSISFSSRFHTSSESTATATPKRVNGFTNPGTTSLETTFTLSQPSLPNVPIDRSPCNEQPIKTENGRHPAIRPGFLAYTPLRAADKPRAPTPIDDGSWSSTSSTYNTKLNTVLNRKGYFEPERRNAVKKGKSPPQSDSGSSVSSSGGYLVRNKTKRPEPYLLPRPRLAEKASKTVPPAVDNLPYSPAVVTSSLSSTGSFNMFEDNFVSSITSGNVKTPVGAQVHSLVQKGENLPHTSRTLRHSSPNHTPSPTSSSVSSQPKPSQDRHHSLSPPFTFFARHSRPNSKTTSTISSSSSFRPFDIQPSKAPPVTSPVTATTHMYNAVQYQAPPTTCTTTVGHYQTLNRVHPSSCASNIQDGTSEVGNYPVNLYNHYTSAAKSSPRSSPTKITNEVKVDGVLPQISPRRRAKSAESLLPQGSEEDAIVSPPATPVLSKKSVSPSSLSGKFAKAKKLFGIRKHSESSYYRAQSSSLTDVSQNIPQGVSKPDSDMSIPQGVSLSDGDGYSCLNSTFTVEAKPTSGSKVKHAFPVPSSVGTTQTVDSKHRVTKDNAVNKLNGMNGPPKRRGIFGNRSNFFSGHHTNGAVHCIEERLIAVESANQRVTHEAKTGVPPQQLGKQEHHQDGGRKVPNYLQMTKAAASKRVTRPQVNKENKGHSAQSNGKVPVKSKKLLGIRSRDRDITGFKPREHTTPQPQLVW